MKFLYTLFCLLLVVVSTACNSGGTASNDDGSNGSSIIVDQGSEHRISVLPGKVIDTIACGEGQSYALYIPKRYSKELGMPLLICFDAHARGSVPVRAYQKVADDLGCILAASNTSRNGMEMAASVEAATNLLQDIRRQLTIDTNKIFTCGFSGGARVASAIALIKGGIAGVIGCGAGFPNLSQPPVGRFRFVGVAGDADFNFTELLVLDNELQKAGFQHTFIEFTGSHAWPPESVFRLALTSLIMGNAGDDRLNHEVEVYSTQLINEGKLVAAVRFLDGVVSYMGESAGKAEILNKLAQLKNRATYKQQLAEEKDALASEGGICRDLSAQLSSRDQSGWKKTIMELRKNAIGSSPKSAMYKRVISYLGLSTYMAASRQLQSNDLEAAAASVQQFHDLEPKNPDGWYLEAVYYLKKSDTGSALAALLKCAEAGYDRPADINTDANLASLRNLQPYTTILERVRLNYLAARTQ